MRTILCASLLCFLPLALLAAVPEDGKVACEDGIDNDADGLTDCEDPICHGSSRSCPLPQKAFVVGLGDERGRPDFDVAMVTIGGTPGQDLLLVDLDGAGPRFDDLIAGRPGDLAVFPNIPTPGKASLPRQPLSRTVQANSRIAGGDYSGDGRADVVAVNSTRMQRYRGNGAGGFAAEGPPVNAVPGPAGGLPAIAGPTIAVANSRLRIYDSCTVQPPDFPATTETFGAGGLCASVAFEVPGTAEVITGFIGPAGVSRFAVVVGPSVQIYEIVRTMTQAGTMVNAVRIGAINTTPFFVNDVAYSTSEDVLIAALSNGRLQARRGDGAVASSLNPTLALRTVNPPEQITRLAIGPLLDGRPTVVAVEQKGEALHVVPFSRNGGWRQRDVVTKAWDTEPTILRRADDIVVGQFNDDSLLDVAVLDAETGNVVLLRQTPRPCATFITSASHGLVLSEDDVPSQEYLQPFSRAINDEVTQINSSRRPANGFRDVATAPEAKCPIRHIEVRGHWERDALPDLAYIGRGGWIGSMWVPAPSCHLIPMLPAFTPWDFWASAYFLLLPNYMPSDAICIADFPIYSDPLTRLRFFVAGIGQGAESLARNWTSQGSRRAAGNINAAIREAITDADAEMDPCTGHIYVDIAAHSRGSAVNSDVLSKGFGKRGNYNFDVSFTLVCGIDPSLKDNMRPHIRAGYIMGDPKIARRGSEWISSFHTGSSQGTSIDWLLDLVPPWVLVDDEYRATEVVGLPVGRDRRAELEDTRRTFGAFEGPLSDLVHVEAMEHSSGYAFVNPATVPPNNIRQPSEAARPDGPSFAFISTTLLGQVMQTPSMDLPFDAVGFHTRSNFTSNDEAICLPVACGGTGSCQDEVGASVELLGQNSQALTAREMVYDGDFRLRTGIVRNARDLVSEHGDLKAALPGSKFLQLREYIVATASALYPAGGRWKRTGAVTLPATGPNMAEGIRTLVAWPGVNYDQLDSPSEVEAELQRWKGELGELTAPGSRDKVNALAAATARGNDGTEAYAQFPSNAVGRLTQDLDFASRVHNRFLVRVEYELGSAAAGASMLSVQLKGAGVSHTEPLTAANGMGRRVAEFAVERSPTPAGGDIRLLLSGKHLRVYSVSARPFFPVRSSVTGSDYELVLFDEGVTWPTAKQLASRHVYRGRRGKLAQIVSTAQLNELAGMLRSDVPAWVDGSSKNGAAGSFRDSAGAILSTSLFRTGTGFSERRPRGAYAFAWSARQSMRLGHSPPAVSVEDTPMGFLVEYPALP